MSELFMFYLIGLIFLAFGAITFITLFFRTAEYGRYAKKGLDYRIAWMIMEAVPMIVFLICYFLGNRQSDIVPIIFMALFVGHYIHRAFIFPFITRGKEQIPVSIMVIAVVFNSINGYLQGRWINTLAPPSLYREDWLISIQFLIGIVIFFVGMVINLHSDHILRTLRKPGETEYKIPYGGIFRFVSCGNYFGEIIEWIGWAILTFSFSGMVFALWVIFNLLPRARTHHKWYQEIFPDYPKNRKAVFPFIY